MIRFITLPIRLTWRATKGYTRLTWRFSRWNVRNIWPIQYGYINGLIAGLLIMAAWQWNKQVTDDLDRQRIASRWDPKETRPRLATPPRPTPDPIIGFRRDY